MTAKEFGQSMFQIGFLYSQALFHMREPYRTAALATLNILEQQLTELLRMRCSGGRELTDEQFGLLMAWLGIIEGVAYFTPDPAKTALFGAVSAMMDILTKMKEKDK